MARKPSPDEKRFVMEKRKPDGSLDFSNPQPPFLVCTENQICDHYFRNNPSQSKDPFISARDTASQEQIRKWYADQGFTWRAKSW